MNLVESLRLKLLAERRKNLLQEIQIRKEMGDAMLQQIMEAEELHRCSSGSHSNRLVEGSFTLIVFVF